MKDNIKSVKDILGQDVEVHVIDESITPKEGCFHLCPRSDLMPKVRVLPGSVELPCSMCGELCWVSPDGQRVQAIGKNPLICLPCAKIIVSTENKGAN